jgi:hypothetical protein
MIPTYHKRHSKLADRDVLRCIRLRTIGVDSTALVEQISDNFHATYYDHWSTADYDAIDRSILLRPFSELKILVLARDLVLGQPCPENIIYNILDVDYQLLAE